MTDHSMFHRFAYIAVDDVDSRFAKALLADGTVRRVAWDVPGPAETWASAG